MTNKEYELRAEFHRLEGYCNAINHYGIWKDGIQTIGCMQTFVVDIDKKLKKQRDNLLVKIKQSCNTS